MQAQQLPGNVSGDALTLQDGFLNPPAGARPRVWWHWMNGNISKEGIKLDLEWMHRVGIAGFQNFDAALSTPQVVEKRLAYMTPEWKEAFKYATNLADQLGMEEAIAGSPGWSESGGPWVPPADGMKKYVWSETVLEGGKPFAGKLAAPPSETGPFQNIDCDRAGRATRSAVLCRCGGGGLSAARKRCCRSRNCTPKMSASGGNPDFALLSNGDLQKTTGLPVPALGEVFMDSVGICRSRRR